MSQKNVEMIFGKLATDEEFRRTFLRDPRRTLLELKARGIDLTPCETVAILSTDTSLFERVADAIDPRLQKASLKPDAIPDCDPDTPPDERRPS